VPANSGWSLSAIDVNAYYMPFFNAIYLPYGITTMPLYSAHLPTPYNIAGLGAIIAHEIGHAIDPSGVNFNALGQYRPWLSLQSQHSMTQVETCLTTLYNFTDDPLHTLNENFADTFSVLVLQHLAPHPSSDIMPRQFWLDWAQTWCKISTHLAPHIPFPKNTDVHAQARYRIKGMVAQNPALAHAYTCPVHTTCLHTT
jgi:predicted metalloendopeptidase